MRKISSLVSALACALVLPLSTLASNPPALPVLVYGQVTVNGSYAPVGTVVVAQAGNAAPVRTTLTSAGKYALDIPADKAPIGTVIKFQVNGQAVADSAQKFKMVDVATTPSVEYDLAITTSSSSSGGGGTTTGNKTITPVTPTVTTTGTISGDEDGQVLDATAVNVIDGDIIQCKSSADPNAVYIVKIAGGKKYIRHIVSLEIFNHYKHLRWENLIQVPSLVGFNLSGWVRVNTGANGQPGAGDRVWEINGDQTRHWIDMTAAEFLQHGGSEEAIFNINAGELDLYREGPVVKLK